MSVVAGSERLPKPSFICVGFSIVVCLVHWLIGQRTRCVLNWLLFCISIGLHLQDGWALSWYCCLGKVQCDVIISHFQLHLILLHSGHYHNHYVKWSHLAPTNKNAIVCMSLYFYFNVCWHLFLVTISVYKTNKLFILLNQ